MAILHVTAGQSVSAALSAAAPGDEVRLEAGATFTTGQIDFPAKASGSPIRITTSAVGSIPDRRIGPGDAGILPTIVSGGTATPFLLPHGRNNWHFDGIRFLPNNQGGQDMIQLSGSGAGGLNDNIRVERCLFEGATEQKRFMFGSGGTNVVIARNYIAGIRKTGEESCCLTVEYGAGPWTITDNYFEAASINVLFGGGTIPVGDAYVAADILFENNHCFKRTSWLGAGFAVKNLFELKSAKRVTVRDNVFENNWNDGQPGWGIVFTSRNQYGDSPWSVIRDVTFERNKIVSLKGVNILGVDDGEGGGATRGTPPATNIYIRHNLFILTSNFYQIGGEAGVVVIEHNTVDNDGPFGHFAAGNIWPVGASAARAAVYACANLTVRNNLGYGNNGGQGGDAVGQGTAALNAFCSAYTWTHNVLAGGSGTYPAVTTFPAVATHEAEFEVTGGGAATPVFDAASTSAIAASGVIAPWAHTCAGVDRYLRVLVVSDWSANVTGVTYAGLALSKLASVNVGGPPSIRLEWWYLLNPPAGTANVVVTGSDPWQNQSRASAVSYTNVHQVTTHGTHVTASGTGATASATATSATGELVMDAVGVRSLEAGISVGAGQTSRVDTPAGGYDLGASDEAGAASVDATWTVDGGGSRLWASIAVSVRGAAASGTNTYRLASASTYKLAGSDSLDLGRVWDTSAAANQAPVVSAGADQAVTIPSVAALVGSATDDGLPTPPVLTYLWTKVSGPGTVAFTTPTLLTALASFDQPGVYVLRLTVSDGLLSGSDDVTITASLPAPVDEVVIIPLEIRRTVTVRLER